MIRDLCKWKEVNLIEGEVCIDHVHILVEIPPKISVSSFMGFLKGKTSIMIYQKYGNMKFKYRNRNFWCRGYYVDTAGKDAKKIQKYIQDQLKEDELSATANPHAPRGAASSIRAMPENEEPPAKLVGYFL